MGISSDGSSLLIITYKFVFPGDFFFEAILVNNLGGSPSFSNFNSDGSPGWLRIEGNIAYVPGIGFYGVGSRYSVDDGLVGAIFQLTPDTGSGILVADIIAPITISGDNLSGCNNLFFIQLNTANYFVTRNTDGGSNEFIFCNGTTLNFSVASYSPSTTLSNYFVAIANPVNNTSIYLYAPTFSGGTYLIRCLLYDFANITLSSQYNLPYDPTGGLPIPNYRMTYSLSGGSGLLRFYYSGRNSGNINCNTKLYQTSGGSSTGGDPHIRMLGGREIKFYDEREVLLFDSLSNLSERLIVRCDTLQIRNISPHLKNFITEEQMEKLFQNESYLNNIYIDLINDDAKRSLKINTISFEMDGDEFLKKCFYVSDITDGENFQYKSNIFSPFRFSVIKKMDGLIKINHTNFSIEIIRTKCIHLSDFHISINGNIELEKFGGAIITGEI